MGSKSFLFLVLIFFINLLHGQERTDEQRAIVFMDDGSRYQGLLLERKKKSIKLQIYKDHVIEIDVVDMAGILDDRNALVYDEGKYHKTTGIYYGGNFGFSAITKEGDDTSSGHFETYVGWRFGKRWALSHGWGLEANQNQIAGLLLTTEFFSAFLKAKYFINDHRYRMFSYMRAGYGFVPDENQFESGHSGGGQFQIGVGLTFPSTKKLKFIVSLGYHVQKTDGEVAFIDSFGNQVNTEFDLFINRIIFKGGMEF